ncbi:hypothetical protein C8T65DRAFT_743182 [Cerioporus squamosus]|nr:hypothetical protein C8T65DRAFT_743182 [Cerioporus squamosus]
MTPPPSYASLFKSAGAPAPRPPGGSRAAVWPSRQPSPVLRITASTSLNQQRSAATLLSLSHRRAIEETRRRVEDRYRTGGPPRDRDPHPPQRRSGPGALPRSAQRRSGPGAGGPHMVVHSYSYSYVQETVIQGSTRHRSDPWTSPEEGWLPVKERVFPSQSQRSDVTDRASLSRTGPFKPQRMQLVQAEVQFLRDSSYVLGGRTAGRAGKNVAGRPSSSVNVRDGGATLRPW